MLTLALGCAVLLATTLAFWFALPADGKVRGWITPGLEPLVAVAFVLAAGVGVILLILAAASALA